MDPYWSLAIVIGGVVIASLAFYAGKLLFQVKQQAVKEQAFIAEVERKQKSNNDYLIHSVRTIAKAVGEEQCELSEAAIRICVMLNNFAGYEDAYIESYPGFYRLYNAIRDLPTHQAYKDLPAQERAKQNMLRWNQEADVKELMLAEAQVLANFQ